MAINEKGKRISKSTAARILDSLRFKKPNIESYNRFQEKRKPRQAAVKPVPQDCSTWKLARKPHQPQAQSLSTHPHSAFSPPTPRVPAIDNEEALLQKQARASAK